MKNTKKKEDIPLLTEKQKGAIENYLESRLGIFGIKSYEFKWDEPKISTSSMDGKRYLKEWANQEVALKNCGILQHIMRKVVFEIEVTGNTFPRNVWTHFHYEHYGMGRNGHEADIKLLVHEDGRIYEIGDNK